MLCLGQAFSEAIFEHITALWFLRNSIFYEEIPINYLKTFLENGAWHRIKNKLLAGKQKPGTADLKIYVQYSGAWHNLYLNGRNLLFGRRFSLRYGRFPSCLKTTNSDGAVDAKHFHTPQFDAVLSDWVLS